MKTIDGFKMRSLGKDYIIVGEGAAQVNFNKMISLNSTAAYLWESVCDKGSFTIDQLKDLLLAKYNVDAETAARDAAYIAGKWVEFGIAKNE